MRTLYCISFVEPKYLSNAEEFEEEINNLIDQKKQEDAYRGLQPSLALSSGD